MPTADEEAKAARRHLERILESPGFARNERLSRFLRFVVEQHLAGRDEEIKESVIAIEVFDRRADHDPKQDSIVRTEAARLRARLREYYAEEGKRDTMVIELPKGGYVPSLTRAQPADQSVDTLVPSTRQPGKPLWVTVALAVVIVAAVIGGLWLIGHRSQPIPIAVLPLANLSPDSSNDYFADGLTDEIIRNLSIIEGLAVRSQTSSFAFKGKPQNIREAGRQLNVNYILEGSVLRSGGQLRVNVQLVRVNDDFPLWSGRYEREQADVLAIQDEISRGIVNSLRLKLGRGRRRYETSTDVYDLYLRARAVSVENGINGINNNIGSLEEVIARDPSFAPAYADLAGAYAIRSGEYRFNIPDEVSKMRAAAEKAVQLDPLLAQAHYAQGAVYARDGQWRDAEQSFRRAIELDPNDPTSRIGIAVYLLWSLGKTDQAVRQMREAEKADPLSPNVHELLANILISARRYREAASELEQLPADAALKSWLVSRVKIGEGRIDEAIQDLEAHYRRGGLKAGDQNWGLLVYAYARGGRRRDAETVVATMPPNPINMVLAYAGLGDKDRVFEALDRASTGGAVRIGRTLTWPELAFIQSDPRVKQLRKKVRLPE